MTPRDPERGHRPPAQFPGAKLHPGRRSGGRRHGVPPPGRGAPAGSRSGAPASVPSRRAQPVRPRTTPEAPRPRPRRAQRPSRRVAAAQAVRAAHLRQRPAVLRGVRDAGDPDRPDPGAGRRSSTSRPWLAVGVVVPADHGGAVLPPGGARLPVRWWRLRGRDEEPRAVRGARRRQRAAGRLRDDRGGLGLRRHRQHHLGVPAAGRVPRADRRRAWWSCWPRPTCAACGSRARRSPCRRTCSSAASR